MGTQRMSRTFETSLQRYYGGKVLHEYRQWRQFSVSAVHSNIRRDCPCGGPPERKRRLYHQEYRSTTGPFATQKDNDLPCVVCLDGLHSSTILHPARNDCPTGFHLQYHGYLIGAQYTSSTYDSIETTCVDHEGRTVPFTSAAVNGGYLMPVDGKCISGTALPCTHYIDGFELTCAMCSV
ncbi:uncharacterized protein [Ptychodera flava]|uniref:uncharacterized protein n=1 Tax=Ptychodera flava TaxID=63121 RepID=UPI00396A6B0C